jgi:chemotaxis signal transduction protein
MNNDFANINALKGLVIFTMDDHELCANIAEVPAIIKPGELKKYFNLYSEGDRSIRQYGNNFPVIDSNTFFSYGKGELTPDSRILLINCGKLIFALLAGKVLEIITLNRRNGENCLKFTPIEEESYIKGVIHYEDKSWLFPDFAKISSKLQSRLNSFIVDSLGSVEG